MYSSSILDWFPPSNAVYAKSYALKHRITITEARQKLKELGYVLEVSIGGTEYYALPPRQ